MRRGVATAVFCAVAAHAPHVAFANDPPPPPPAASSPRAAPFIATSASTPSLLLCTGNMLVAAQGSKLAFFPRTGSGGTPMESALTTPIGRDATLLRSGMRNGELVVIVASEATHSVWELARGAWTTLTPPLVSGEQIADAALRGETTYLLTTKALYIRSAAAEWTRLSLSDVVGETLFLVGNQLWLMGHSASQKGTVFFALTDDNSALAAKAVADVLPLSVGGLWVSGRSLWLIANDEKLRRLDLDTGKIAVTLAPKVGVLHSITGTTTTGGDVIVVTGEASAYFDVNANKFAYPSGATAGSIACLDIAGRYLYVSKTFGLKRINANHHLFTAAPLLPDLVLPNSEVLQHTFFPAQEVPVEDSPVHGPLVSRETAESNSIIPSFRAALGWGRFPREKEPDQLQLDVLFGLRIFGVKDAWTSDKAHFFLHPEVGYSSGPDRYAMISTALSYGNVIGLSGGPFVAGLLSTQGDVGIRSGVRASVLAGLFQAELAHQYVDKDPKGEHGFRAIGSVDLFGAGIILLVIGVPICLTGAVISAALRH